MKWEVRLDPPAPLILKLLQLWGELRTSSNPVRTGYDDLGGMYVSYSILKMADFYYGMVKNK